MESRKQAVCQQKHLNLKHEKRKNTQCECRVCNQVTEESKPE